MHEARLREAMASRNEDVDRDSAPAIVRATASQAARHGRQQGQVVAAALAGGHVRWPGMSSAAPVRTWLAIGGRTMELSDAEKIHVRSTASCKHDRWKKALHGARHDGVSWP
ncbi:hypothetical protein [Noviherbaspirillum pedocola]|uniref:Uncharacterized protein n=1 Tax=Noviherbaspirillum pedocola TaxID=2801341 RepID=A0A934SWC7_9BURK|nr:hypothetical protein [Noviherbaspirillum pedocola]MBK4736580.1 hypothetical protein [Noviherbaspirillum pedocola]